MPEGKRYVVVNRRAAVNRHIIFDVAASSESRAVAKVAEVGDLVILDGDAELTISTGGEWSVQPGILDGTYQLERPVTSAVLRVRRVYAFSREGAVEAVREMYPDGWFLIYDADSVRSAEGSAPPDGWDAEEE